jgi:ATP-dependent Clp endopeptidase proteolytic subunit ClpP
MFTNNTEEPQEEEAPHEESHMMGPLAEDEPPLMGLVGDITEEAAQQLAMSLLGFNGGKILATPDDLDDDGDIEFFISSGGGSVNDMFSVYDLMRVVKANRDIATFAYGRVYSAAVLLMAAGTPGKRYIAKNARMMIHHCSSNAGGTHPDIRANFDELKKVEDMMVEELAANSSLSVGEIYNIMSRNTDEFFSAQDALEMGLVDKII